MVKKLDEFVIDTIESLIDRDEKLNKIISDKLYINWLKEFSKTHTSFDNETILYDGEISQEDQNKALEINLLIDALLNYCEQNDNAEPIVDNKITFKNYHFNIKDGDFNFTIGRIFGQGCFEYFSLSPNKDEQIIDFNDVIEYSQQINKNEDIMEK